MTLAPQSSSPPASPAAPAPALWLASRSPRRAQMLHDASLAATILPADIDDAQLRHGDVPPEWWVMSLAYLKARRVADMLREKASRPQGRAEGRFAVANIEASSDLSMTHALVLGADTVCAVGRSLLGQPRDAEDARRMLRLMRSREHRTITGVCLLSLERAGWRLIVFDAAVVRLGEISDDDIEGYVSSGDWRGKAGGYNLSERVAAGWPISCLGDPTTVMGLPMQRLEGWISRARQVV